MDVQQAIFCWPFSFGGKALHLFAFINPKMPFLFLSCLTPLPLSPSAGSCGLVLHGMYGAEEHHCGCSVSTVTRCCSLSCFVPPLFPSLLHFCLECCVSELCAHWVNLGHIAAVATTLTCLSGEQTFRKLRAALHNHAGVCKGSELNRPSFYLCWGGGQRWEKEVLMPFCIVNNCSSLLWSKSESVWVSSSVNPAKPGGPVQQLIWNFSYLPAFLWLKFTVSSCIQFCPKYHSVPLVCGIQCHLSN